MAIDKDLFSNEISFRDAESIFKYKQKSISEIKADCLIFVDTNVLLAPYSLSDKSVEQVRSTYQRLAKASRIYITAQVAREFAKNRASRVGDMLKTLLDQASKQQSPLSKRYSILANFENYTKALEISKEIECKQEDLKKCLINVADEIKQ